MQLKRQLNLPKKATETDGKGGVFWHTQGSGKSLSMVFYAHLLQLLLNSSTIIVLTDRNDLDNQLYARFSTCKDFYENNELIAITKELTDILRKNKTFDWQRRKT